MVPTSAPPETGHETTPDVVHQLAQFRFRLRRFLRFSERSARSAGVTPLQHQLMLGIAGFTGPGWATVSDLAEFLQDRHNAVVALVNRAERDGLVLKRKHRADRRVVRVHLTARGRRILAALSSLHQDELTRFLGDTSHLLAPWPTRSRPQL